MPRNMNQKCCWNCEFFTSPNGKIEGHSCKKHDGQPPYEFQMVGCDDFALFDIPF